MHPYDDGSRFVPVPAGPFDRLFRALLDDASCDRAVFALLVGYTVVFGLTRPYRAAAKVCTRT